jgi:hypothetical protein
MVLLFQRCDSVPLILSDGTFLSIKRSSCTFSEFPKLVYFSCLAMVICWKVILFISNSVPPPPVQAPLVSDIIKLGRLSTVPQNHIVRRHDSYHGYMYCSGTKVISIFIFNSVLYNRNSFDFNIPALI